MLEYSKFKKYFKDKYGIKKDNIFYFDDNDVVDDCGIDTTRDGDTLCDGKGYILIDYAVTNEDEFAEKIYNAFVDKYGQHSVDLYLRKIKPVFTGKHADYANACGMDCEGKDAYLYIKDKMSYGDNFKYGDMFDYVGAKATRIIGKIMNCSVHKAWRAKDNPEVILIAAYTHGLTDVETLSNHADIPEKEIYRVIVHPEEINEEEFCKRYNLEI